MKGVRAVLGNMVDALTLKISNFILGGARSNMTNIEFLEKEITQWKFSPQRIMQIKGFLYYSGDHDITHRRRMVIGENGELEEVKNLPNNRVVDNQYAKMVDQKTNYLFGQPFTVDSDNDQYAELLKDVFNAQFKKTLKSTAKYAYNGGIAWLYPYYTEEGKLSFRLFPSYEIKPYWKDSEHTILDFAIRLYLSVGYEANTPKVIERVEIFDLDGIHRFILDGEKLLPDVVNYDHPDAPYMTMVNGEKVTGMNWERVPLIAFRYNESEESLLKRVKPLQDGINAMLSDFENNIQEDARNTILVLKNYDGTNLGEFRRNLATYGAVKVRYDGDAKGGVETLQITVNADNYKAIVEIFKKALIENAMGYDAKDDRLNGNPNQMNIQSMYSDIDIAANDTETEFQASFEQLRWFINVYFANSGCGDFDGVDATLTFNRDILINESEAIDNCAKSVGILSDETVVNMHPWTDDLAKELERIEEQKKKEQERAAQEYDPFRQQQQPPQNGDRGSDGQGGGVNGEE